ncbi:MAG: hypothetical protein QW607_11710 [Desulfurococcaceae archaeon]
MSRTTPLHVKRELKEEMEKYRGNLTWSDFVEELFKTYVRRSNPEEIVEFSEKVQLEDVLQAIESVKPPTKWRDMILYFIIAVFGGTGLGIILPW